MLCDYILLFFSLFKDCGFNISAECKGGSICRYLEEHSEVLSESDSLYCCSWSSPHFIDQHKADLTRLRLLLNKRTGAAWLWRQDVRHVNMYQALKLDTSLSLWDSKQYLYMQSSIVAFNVLQLSALKQIGSDMSPVEEIHISTGM